MNLMRFIFLTSLMAGSGSALFAADYYISPRQAGTVAGAALASVSLQANTDDEEEEEEEAEEQPTRLKKNVVVTGGRIGKWVRVGEKPPITTTPKTPTTPTTTTGGTQTGTGGTTAVPGLSPLATPVAGKTYASFGALVSAQVLKAGDRVFLMGGYHGPLTVDGLKFTAPVTVAQMPGQVAHVEGITVLNSTNIVFRDFKVWNVKPQPGNVPLIRTYASSSDITFGNLDIRSVANSTQYASWNQAAWMANYRAGMYLDGARQKAIGNRLTGIYHGIQTAGPANVMAYNIIDGFAADGLRALGDDAVVRSNKVQNCFQIDGNHADGLQSWSRGANGAPGTGTVRNMTIENNKFLEWTLSSTNPLRCKLQGIGFFDGMYDGFKINNNLVVASGYHGIAVAGGTNMVISQNTVVNANGQIINYPWIRTTSHKNGTPERSVRVANNTANAILSNADAARSVVVANNVVVTNFTSEFTAPKSFDFSLRPTAKSANAGSKTYATAFDIMGVPRPKGTSADCGAYESQ